MLCGQHVILALMCASTRPHIPIHSVPDALKLLNYCLLPVGAAMWLVFLALVVYERQAAHRLLGRSLRLWLLFSFVICVARTVHLLAPPATFTTTTEHVEALQVVPALMLALVALLTADTPADLPSGERSYFTYAKDDEDEVDEAAASAAGSAVRPRLKPVNREATSCFASRLTFAWLSSLLATGARRPLEHEDLYQLQARDSAEYNSRRLSQAWAARRAMPGVEATMLRAWHDAFGVQFWMLGTMQLMTVLLSYAPHPTSLGHVSAHPHTRLGIARGHVAGTPCLSSST